MQNVGRMCWMQDRGDRQGQVVVALLQLHGHLAKRLLKEAKSV